MSLAALHRHRHTHGQGPPDLEVLALSAEAWRLHAEALTLAYHPVRILEVLQGITRLLVELTAGAGPPQP
jgi:hypothetical protein